MSDPVTNVEIEDVLSSIRRLVSEDARVRPVGWQADPVEAVAAQEAAGPPEVGRLVLTPALRVSDEAASAEAVAEEPVAEEPEAVAEDAPGQGDQMAEAEVASAPEVDELPRHDPWEDTSDEADSAAEVYEPESEPETVSDAVDLSSDAADLSVQDDVSADEVHEPYVLAAQDDAAMVWEDHHDDDLRISDLSHGGMTDVVEDTAADTFYEDAEEVAAPVMEEAPMPEDAAFVFATSRDGATREAESAASDASQSDDDALDDRAFLLSEDEAILDEETLREMVAEIVRQELQGALGERITRNVRKLVRREIHRALTSHELE